MYDLYDGLPTELDGLRGVAAHARRLGGIVDECREVERAPVSVAGHELRGAQPQLRLLARQLSLLTRQTGARQRR